MSAHVLDGKKIALQIKEQLRLQVDELKAKYGLRPVVVSLLSMNDSAAKSYVASQKKTADELGIDYRVKQFSNDVSVLEFEKSIAQLNHDKAIHAVLINKPVPSQIDFAHMLNLLSEKKDIEGLNHLNLGRLFLGETQLLPCTAAAVMEILKMTDVPLKGKDVVIVGRSEIVGKPLIFLLLAQNATVTVCHSQTDKAGRLKDHLSRADVIVAAVGRPGFIKGDWIKSGAVVIDVGINRVDGKLTGDVDFDSVSQIASMVTPVPGGVGPVTAIMLMKNVIETFKQQLLT